MTSLKYVSVRDFAPKAWGGILGLLASEGDLERHPSLGGGDGQDCGRGETEGGDGEARGEKEREWELEWGKVVEDMIDEGKKVWGDGFIVNLGREGWEDEVGEGDESERGRGERLRGLDGWHVDGDFFVHYCEFFLFLFSSYLGFWFWFCWDSLGGYLGLI